MPLQADPGTLISGTHNEGQLVAAFLSELEDLNPPKAASIRNHYGLGFIERVCSPGGMDYPTTGETDRAGWLMEDLYDALDECAPDGHYFGAHPGDGADFGFWEAEG